MPRQALAHWAAAWCATATSIFRVQTYRNGKNLVPTPYQENMKFWPTYLFKESEKSEQGGSGWG